MSAVNCQCYVNWSAEIEDKDCIAPELVEALKSLLPFVEPTTSSAAYRAHHDAKAVLKKCEGL